ncbi:MAG: hypothetical protein KJ709_01220 [Nanoarchaeota archaeon]|nr:hypothetical protein [Nanoarchaeota archaeon]
MNDNNEMGARFEIFIEALFNAYGLQNVRRDVEFRKLNPYYRPGRPGEPKYIRRQCDITYDIVKEGNLYLAAAELKYTSNGQVSYSFRDGPKRKKGQMIPRIGNLVDEVYERQLFIEAYLSLLVTNKKFQKKVKKEAEKRGIKVMEGNDLQAIIRKLGGKYSVDDYLVNIRTEDYDLRSDIRKV